MTVLRQRPGPDVPALSGQGPDGASTGIRLARPWLAGTAIVLAGAVLLYYVLVARSYHLDLTVYRSAVRWWWAGHDPYARAYSVHGLEFTYPPFALVLLSPLASLPAGAASLVWFLVNVAAVAASFYLVFRSLGVRGSTDLWLGSAALSGLTVFLLEPVRSTLDYGQVNAVIMLACLFDLLRPGWRGRGLLVGVSAALKLTPLFLLLYLAVARDLRALVRAVVAFAAGTAMAWLVLPNPSHAFWSKLVWQPERTGKLSYPGNLSWDAVIVRTGLGSSPARALWLVAAAVTVAVGTLAAARCLRAGAEVAGVLVVALTGLLASPVSWSHHWIWMVLAVPLMLVGRDLRSGVRLLLGGLTMLVVAAPYWWFHGGAVAAAAEALTPVCAFALLCVVCVGGPLLGPARTDAPPSRPRLGSPLASS